MPAQPEQEIEENTPNLVEVLPAKLLEALPGLRPDDAALILAVAWKLAMWRNIEGMSDGNGDLTASQRGEAPKRLMRMRHHLVNADKAAGRKVPAWVKIPD